MHNRSRLLKGATALLYFGPLLAGLSGAGWAVVPVFAGIFLLWLVIVRPQEFPKTLADWTRSESLIAISARMAVQLLLVLVLFGVGRGIGGVLGSLPSIPLMLPIGVSFLAIPIARLIWDPWKADAMEKLLDDSLAKIEDGAAMQGGDRAYAEAVTAPLNGLSDDVTEAELESHLSALRALVDESVTFDVLLARVQSQEASVAGKRALMLMASDAACVDRIAKHRIPMRAMDALAGEPDLIARMSERLITALRRDQDMWDQCPDMGFLEALRIRLPAAITAITALQAEIVAQAPRD
ncbi:hypothetical protein [Pseudorhodobacter ferrugineus]|uniref:hypothetical protein n=1 Tax=Pseudorhodobacter ferrugineus TaxID=77008 RepID=UPI0012DD92BC|nr:hypothetical protein [Pseudorhodobacter ferrugineus]